MSAEHSTVSEEQCRETIMRMPTRTEPKRESTETKKVREINALLYGKQALVEVLILAFDVCHTMENWCVSNEKVSKRHIALTFLSHDFMEVRTNCDEEEWK